MIIIQRKRIMLIIGTVFISIFIYLLGSSHMYEVVETVSTPITGKTVVLDAGHGRRRWRSRV